MKTLALLFILSINGFSACVSSHVSGIHLWSLGASWAGCAGTGGIPATSDTPTITTGDTISLDSNQTVVAVHANGSLTSDCSGPHTLTLSSATGPQFTGLGPLFVPTPVTNFIDTRSCTVGQELTIDCTASTATTYNTPCILYGDQFNCNNVYLNHVILKLSATNYGLLDDDFGSCNILSVTNVLATGGVSVIQSNEPTTEIISNLTWTGGNGAAVLVGANNVIPTTCTISNVTILDPIGNSVGVQSFLNGQPRNFQNCIITGISANADVGGTFSVGGVYGGVPGTASTSVHISYVATNQYNLAIASSVLGFGVIASPGTSGKIAVLDHTSGQNDTNCILFNLADYTQMSYNVCYPQPASVGAAQGCEWAESNGGTNITLDHEECVQPINQLLFYVVGFGTPPPYTSVIITNSTGYTIDNTQASSTGDFGLGEPGGNVVASPSGMYDNVDAHGFVCYMSNDGASVFGTAGTGGVGVSNNDCYAPISATYNKAAPSTNFDNGVTSHPNAIYGDVAINPFLYEVTRTYARCDEILKSLSAGAGTAEDLFTELGKQWNATNSALVTPQNVWNCMYVPVVPQNPALNTLSRSGGFIGSQAPVILSSGARRR